MPLLGNPGRLGAILYVGAGSARLLQILLDAKPDGQQVEAFAVGIVATALGLIGLLVDWHRLPGWVPLGAALVALGLIGWGERTDMASVSVAGAVATILVFLWLGLTQARVVILGASIMAFAAVVVPHAGTARELRAAIGTGVIVIGMALLVSLLLARLVAELQRPLALKDQRLAILSAVAVALRSPHEGGPDPLSEIAELALKVFGGDGAVVLTGGPDDWQSVHGLDKLPALPAFVGIAESFASETALTGRPAQRVLTAEAFSGALLAIPIMAGRRLEGVVILYDASQGWSLDETMAELLELFGTQTGSLVHHERGMRRLLDEASRDPLTGVGNRRHAHALLAALASCDVVGLVDVDGLKALNDTEGHAAGDEVLRGVADYLRSNMRDPDDVARYGGDEFLLVLRDAAKDAAKVGQRLVEGWDPAVHACGFSVGFACHVDGTGGGATLARADAALYRAKKAGGHRVVVDPTGAPTTAGRDAE